MNVRNIIRALAGVAMLTGIAVGFGGQSHSIAAAAQGDHFKATGPDRYQGGDDSMFSPADFEASAAANPVSNSLIYFSRCRRAPFAGSTSFYNAFTNNNVDAIVNDQPLYVAGDKCWQPENEQNIVSNPNNPNNIVTASNDYRSGFTSQVYTSMNHGATWTNVVLPGWDPATGGQGFFSHVQAGGDPVLSFAPDGTLYYAALAYDFSYASHTPDAVGVAVSHDGGQTWSAPRVVASQDSNNFFDDKEWVAAGPNGEVIVTWTRFNQGPHGTGYIASPIVSSISHDFGNTWSSFAPISDSSHPYNQGSSPVIAPNGTIYVAYEGATPSTGYNGDATVIASSTDGGASWTNTEIGRVYDDYNCYPIQSGFQYRQRLSYEQFRLNSFPSLALDPTNGHLAVAWADDRANASCGYEKGGNFSGLTQNQVFLTTSSNGTAWTAPSAITSGDTYDKVFPAVSANAGRVVVGYYTRKYSPVPKKNDASCDAALLDTTTGAVVPQGTPGVCLDYAIRSSSDGFANETRVSSQSSNPYILFAGSFIGDYTGVNVDSNGQANAVWTDFRGNPGITSPNQDTVVGTGF